MLQMTRDDIGCEERQEGDFEEKGQVGQCGFGLYTPTATTLQTTTRPQDLEKLVEEVEAQFLPPHSNSLSQTVWGSSRVTWPQEWS